MTVASLPMYDLPSIREATNAWWRGLARAFREEGILDVPAELSRGPGVRDLWTSRDLLFSQTCGYPFIRKLRKDVTLLATPCYAAKGCAGSDYSSVIVVPAASQANEISDLESTVCAVNGRDSHSGYNILRALIAPHAQHGSFFRDVKISGNHPASLRLVADGEADVASIDCVTYALLARHEPDLIARTRALRFTPHAPGLPYITSSSTSPQLVAKLRNGLRRAFNDPELADSREALLLSGYEIRQDAEYERLARIEQDAASKGYPELA